MYPPTGGFFSSIGYRYVDFHLFRVLYFSQRINKPGATMKHIALIAQVATLSMSWSSNSATAMAGAAAFSVLCVVAVALKSRRRPMQVAK
jgi:hypothetical protein